MHNRVRPSPQTPQQEPPADAPTLRSVIERYRPQFEEQLTAESAREYRRYGRCWAEALGDLLVDQVAEAHIERWMADRATKLTPGTINRAVAFLKLVLNLAVRDKLLQHNAALQVKMLRVKQRPVRVLSEMEIVALLEASPPAIRLMVQFALMTGLRQTEQLTLRREEVDLEAATVTVCSNHGRKRHIPLNLAGVELLQTVLGSHSSKWVFPGPGNDAPWSSHRLHHGFCRATTSAGIKNLRWHDLRHTFGRRLAVAGVSARVIQELMGHGSSALTVRYL